MISDTDVLFVCDGDNIFKAVQATYGKDRRISYIKLIERLRESKPLETCYHLHVFVTVREHLLTQMPFVSRLSMLGFTVHPYTSSLNDTTGEVHRQDTSKDIIHTIAEFRCKENYPRTLVVATSSGAYADLYTALAYQGVNIEVWYFGPNLSSKIMDVSKRVQLGEDVLYTQEDKTAI